ncbi:MAG: CapA family protein [Hyphomicrobiaceae bacterium]|nr:CapA family protein [Hyphomicrobiaceae bacterium]
MWRAGLCCIALAAALTTSTVLAGPDEAAGSALPAALATVPDATVQPAPAEPDDSVDHVTIVLAGDTGLNGGMQPVRADGALRHGRLIPWEELTSGVRGLIAGDLAFANLETVVTERNDLPPVPKAFNFRSHPAGVKHLVGLGFNLFSTANNHSMDFGPDGIRDTIRLLDGFEEHGLAAHAGVGPSREEAGRPASAVVKGARVLISAIGIGTGGLSKSRAGAGRPGQLAYHADKDFAELTERLRATPGDYRILSVHYGLELQVSPGSADVLKLREAAAAGSGIDLVVGHHAHVVSGVAEIDGKLIFYGMGNFLHPGMQDMAKFGICRDFGLLARVHLARQASGRLAARAVEVVPLAEMHAKARAMLPADAGARIHVLNHLAEQFDDAASGSTGVRFTPQLDGSGLYCFPGAAEEKGRAGELCRLWQAPPAAPAMLARRIAAACGRSPPVVSRSNAERRQRSRSGSARSAAGEPFIFNPFGL